MKKFTLILLVLGISVLSFGQNIRKHDNALTRADQDVTSPIIKKDFKGDGDVFWNTSFDWANPDDPNGWTLPEGWEVVDNADLGNPIIWSTGHYDGQYTSVDPPSWFVTPEDGYLLMPADQYNFRDGVGTSNGMDSYIQTPPIDCSSKPTVVIKFNQYFRTCCGGDYIIKLMISNDAGVHWADYDLRYATAVNDFTNAEGREVELNVTNVAGGQSGVIFRFYFMGASHYFWMLDDLILQEAYHNEIVIEDNWAEFNNGVDDADEGAVRFAPLSQIGGANNVGDYTFTSGILNNGVENQNNVHLNVEVLHNGTSVYNENSESRLVASLERDTFAIDNPFTATDYGFYEMKYTVMQDEEDQIPENNTFTTNFSVTDNRYQRADFSAESAFGSGGYTAGNISGDGVYVEYDIIEATEINEVALYPTTLRFRDGSVYTDSVEGDMQISVYKYDSEADDYFEILWSELVAWNKEDVEDHWNNVPLEKDGEAEFLEPGNYLVGAKCYIYEDTGMDFRVGYDKGTKSTKSWLWFEGDQAISGPYSKIAQIAMITNETGAPTVAAVTFNVDMNQMIAGEGFTPGTDVVDISGDFNEWGGSDAMTDEDGDGIYSITINDLTVWESYDFHYRINGIPETNSAGEDRTRSGRVLYYNVWNSTMTNHPGAGVDENSLSNVVNVYPNPSQGTFNVFVSSTNEVSLKVMDIQGHVLYAKTLQSPVNHREEINLDLAKGLYFLNVNDGNHSVVKKVIIQ